MTSDDKTVVELRQASGLVGGVISHYRIVQRLGNGGMGVVYKAVDTRLGRTVALKFLSPDSTRDPIAQGRFIREAQIASSLDHINICTIYEVVELDDDQLCIAMAYYQGRTLRELLREGPIPAPLILDIARQTAKGLSSAHEVGIVHRDIKPENILIAHRGEVKILDFGIAKAIQEPSLTRVGVSVGTPMYMSPEQVAGEPTDQRADVWSFGVVLYEMIRGSRPCTGAADAALSSMAIENLGSIGTMRPELALAFGQIIAKCLQINVNERYIDAGDLVAALETLGTQASASPRTANWIPYSALAVAVLLACLFAGFLWIERTGKDEVRQAPPAEQTVASGRTRIAVLPFDNLGPAEDAYFTEGITEEITSRLATIPNLGVISRTSASQYKHRNKSIKQIGNELNVAYVLEGTVRWEHSKDSSHLLVTPQLIRVADDTRLWSAQYERKMEEIFKVQSEIATKIITQLNLNLMQPEWRAIHKRSTSSMDAYHAYLRGLAHLEGLLPVSEESGRAAITRFEEAIRLDPGFALAYARLSMAQSALYQAQFDLSEAGLARAKRNAEKAMELQSDLPEAHIALGYYHYWGYRAYDSAVRELSIAANAQPNNNEVIEALAYIKRRKGQFEEAVDQMGIAFELDPRNPFLARSIGVTLTHLRRYEEADKYYELSISLDSSRTPPYLDRSLNRLLWMGVVKDARAILAEIPPNLQDSDTMIMSWFRQELLEGRPSQALQRLVSAQKEVFWDQEEMAPKELLAAEAYTRLQNQGQAISLYNSAREILRRKVKDQPKDARVRSALAFALAGLGQKDEAIYQAKLAASLVPKDAFVRPYRLIDLALVYTSLGEHEAALDQIEYLLSIPSLLSPQLLSIDPRWSPLRGNPRFEALIKKRNFRK